MQIGLLAYASSIVSQLQTRSLNNLSKLLDFTITKQNKHKNKSDKPPISHKPAQKHSD